jgi:hypothetical protein
MTNDQESMTKRIQALVIGIWSLGFLASGALGAEVTAESSDRGVVVKIDGKLFAEYLTKAGHAPAIWPIIGPTGKPVTRAFPLGPSPPDGTNDHPHHHSFWFTHDEVNDAHFWRENLRDGKDGAKIVPRKLVVLNSTGPAVRIVTQNNWMNDNKRVCEDEQILTFGTRGDVRWIDAAIKIKASDGDVTFGDTKEGTFAVRVADSMRVDAKKGGHIVNSERLEDAAAWGMPARWVDYTGPVDGETVGIAMMSHPKSFRPVPRWHVRTYGLFAANPFGQKDFPHPEAAKQGAYTLKNGDSITLRYRVLLHRGKTNVDELEGAFREFAAE